MHYEVYIDLVFLTNLLMDYILLRAVGKIFRCSRSRKPYTSGCRDRSRIFLLYSLYPFRTFSAGIDTASWRMCCGNAGCGLRAENRKPAD